MAGTRLGGLGACLTDRVFRQRRPLHRHIAWLKSLMPMDASVGPDLQIHVVLDNCASHKHWWQLYPQMLRIFLSDTFGVARTQACKL